MSDKQYFAARAIEERRIAMGSKDPKARAAHFELAARYVDQSKQDADAEPIEEQRA